MTVTITYDGSPNPPTTPGRYTVIGTINSPDYAGSATNMLIISQAVATVTLGHLNQTYDGTAKPVTVTTAPPGLAVGVTYNASADAPTNAGSYTVIGTIADPDYTGGATNMLIISQAVATVTLGNLNQTYDGTAKPVTVTTAPPGLAVGVTYNASADAPTNAGSYTVIGTIADPDYKGSATNTLVIAPASPVPSGLSLSATSSVLPTGEHSFILRGHGPPGTNVVLEYSTNLATPDWTGLTFFTLPGQIEEAYDLFSNYQRRYYRLSASPALFTNALFSGVTRYAGSYPAPADVSYIGMNGAACTCYGACPGWVELLVDPATDIAVIADFINAGGGNIASAIPAAGLYWVQVTNGTTAAFLTQYFSQPWNVDGGPAFAPVLGDSVEMDWDNLVDTDICGALHGSFTRALAGSRASPDDATLVDVHDRVMTLPEEVLFRMVSAKNEGHSLVVNLSLQAPANNRVAQGVNRTGCDDDYCHAIRVQQELFFLEFLSVIDSAIRVEPAVADNALIVIIAGNGGIDLDKEIADAKADYPAAFARMMIVGGTDTNGNISTIRNHLSNNTSRNMVYARSENVRICGCDGTSYAGPKSPVFWIRSGPK